MKKQKGRHHLLGLEYEEDDSPQVNLKRVREGLEQCMEEMATSFAIVNKRIKDALEFVREAEADQDFVVEDEEDNDGVVIVNDDDSNSDWISDADAEKMCAILKMLEHATPNNSFTDLINTESREVRQWWQRVFQDRLDIIDRGFGNDNGKRAQLISRAIRDGILSNRTVQLSVVKRAVENDHCAMCGMTRHLGHKLQIHKTTHMIGKSCAGVVQALIDFWEYLSTIVVHDEDNLEEGRNAYGQLLGYMQAIEQAHENKGKFK